MDGRIGKAHLFSLLIELGPPILLSCCLKTFGKNVRLIKPPFAAGFYCCAEAFSLVVKLVPKPTGGFPFVLALL